MEGNCGFFPEHALIWFSLQGGKQGSDFLTRLESRKKKTREKKNHCCKS